MNSREIELVLKARLEAADASNDAANLGTQLGSAIEKAFDGLGEKLASKFAEEFKNKLSQSNLIPSMSGQGAGSGFGGMAPPQVGGTFGGYDIQQQIKQRSNDDGRWLYSASDNVDKVTNAIASGGGTGGRSNSPGSYWNQPQFAQKTYGAATLLQGFQDDYGNKGNASSSVSRSEANALDDTVRRYRLYQQVSKVNPDFQLSNVGLNQEQLGEAKERLTGLASAAASTLANKDLDKKIELLTAALEKMGDRYEKASNKEEASRSQADSELIGTYDRRQEELHKTIKQRADMQGAVQSATKAASELPSEPTAEPMSMRAGRAMRGVGAAMVVAGELGRISSDWNYLGRRNEAYSTELNSYEGRQRMRGDNSGIVANALEGGTEEQKARAKSRAWGGFWSDLGSGVGQLGAGIGGLFASGAGAVGSGGLATPLAVGGAVISSGVALNGVRTVGGAVQKYRTMDEQIAQNMEAEKASALLKNEEFTRSYNAQRDNRINAYNDAQSMGSDQLSGMLTGYNQNMPGDNIMYRNNGSGLNRGQLLSQQRRFARMGGVFFGENMMDGDIGATKAQTDLNFLTGQGFSNSADSAVAAFRGGGLSRTAAFNQVGAEYVGMRNAGLEETGLVGTMDMKNSRAQQGLDFGASASFGMRQAAGFGADNGMREGFQTQALMSQQYRFQSSTNTGQGLKSIAKSQAIDELEKKMGQKFSEADRIALQLGQIGPEALKRIDKKGRSDEELAALTGSTLKDIEQKTVGLYTGASGGKRDVAQTLLGLETGDGSALSAMNGKMFGSDASPTTLPSAAEVGASAREQRGSTPGRAEKQQDIDTEIAEFMTGIATLKTGFDALQGATDNLVKKFNTVKREVYSAPARAPSDGQFKASPGGKIGQ